MQFSPYTLVILVGVIGAVLVLGVWTSWIGGPSRLWRELAERYPPQQPDPGATRGECRLFLGDASDPKSLGRGPGCLWFFMPWTWFKGMQQARYALDDEHLHLEMESGALGPRKPMSLPWSAVELRGREQTHMGEHAVLEADGVVLLVPAAAIERELAVRDVLDTEATEVTDAEPDGPRRISGDEFFGDSR